MYDRGITRLIQLRSTEFCTVPTLALERFHVTVSMRIHCTVRMRSPRAPPAPGPAAFGEIWVRIAELRGKTSSGEYFPKVRKPPPPMRKTLTNCRLALAGQPAQGGHRVFERKGTGLLTKRAERSAIFYTAFRRNFELRLQFVLGAKKAGTFGPRQDPRRRTGGAVPTRE